MGKQIDEVHLACASLKWLKWIRWTKQHHHRTWIARCLSKKTHRLEACLDGITIKVPISFYPMQAPQASTLFSEPMKSFGWGSLQSVYHHEAPHFSLPDPWCWTPYVLRLQCQHNVSTLSHLELPCGIITLKLTLKLVKWSPRIWENVTLFCGLYGRFFSALGWVTKGVTFVDAGNFWMSMKLSWQTHDHGPWWILFWTKIGSFIILPAEIQALELFAWACLKGGYPNSPGWFSCCPLNEQFMQFSDIPRLHVAACISLCPYSYQIPTFNGLEFGQCYLSVYPLILAIKSHSCGP